MYQAPAGIHQSQGSLWIPIGPSPAALAPTLQQAPAGPGLRPGADGAISGTPLRAHPRVHHTILGQIVPLITRFSVLAPLTSVCRQNSPKLREQTRPHQACRKEPSTYGPARPRPTLLLTGYPINAGFSSTLLVDAPRTHGAGVPAHSHPRPRRLPSSPRPRLHSHLPPGRANPPTQTRMQQLILSPPLAEPGQQRTEGGRHDGRPRR